MIISEHIATICEHGWLIAKWVLLIVQAILWAYKEMQPQAPHKTNRKKRKAKRAPKK